MATSRIPDHIAALKKQFLELEQQSVDLLGPVPADLKESTIEIPLQDGFISHSILIRPSSPPPAPGQTPKKLPLVVLIHGGSFMTCSPKQFLSPGRAVASLLNAVVVSIEYKLAPEHPFPAGPRSAWEVVAWLSKADNLNDAALRAEGLEVDPALGFVLGGGSAGANLAAVIAGVQAIQRHELVEGLPKIAADITGLFVAIPLLLHDDMVPDAYRALYRSREEHADAPFINAKSLAQTREMYKPDTRSAWFSPVNLDFAGMAGSHPRKVYVQVGERDILRDDGVIYERMLKENGIAETKLDVMIGYDHACWCNLPFDPAHTQEIKEKTMDAFSWLMGKDWDRSKTLSY